MKHLPLHFDELIETLQDLNISAKVTSSKWGFITIDLKVKITFFNEQIIEVCDNLGIHKDDYKIV